MTPTPPPLTASPASIGVARSATVETCEGCTRRPAATAVDDDGATGPTTAGRAARQPVRAFEPKLDGRCLAFHRISGSVTLQSRQYKALTEYFPEVAASIIEQVPIGTVLDGELVVYRDGRCDFAALQRRISGRPDLAAATSFVVFDVLALAGRDLRSLPYRKRRKRLRRFLADAMPPLLLMPATRRYHYFPCPRGLQPGSYRRRWT